MQRHYPQFILAALLVCLILAVADLLIITIQILLIAFAGLLFGVFLAGVSTWISRHSPLSYRWAYAGFVLISTAAAVAGFLFLGSQVADSTDQLMTQVNLASDDFISHLQRIDWIERYVQSGLQGISIIDWVMPSAITALAWIGWGLTTMAVIFFAGLYSAFNPELYVNGLVKLVPIDQRPRAKEVLAALRNALTWWIIGRLISMSIIGVLTAAGLWFLGVPLPITLGVLTAMLTFIPNIGPLIAAVPQALLALQVSEATVLYVLVFNFALQGLESYLVTPIIQRYEVSIPPVLMVAMQLLMAVLTGVIGILMTAPLIVSATVLIQLLYIRDTLGDHSPGALTDDA